MKAYKIVLNPEYGLYERDGKAFCDSLQIAETFEKRHDNVLADVRNLDCSRKFNLLNFQEIKHKDERGRQQPKYLMTKDGFTFLVMGYRGKKAAAFKESYIHRFNQMEYFIKSLLTTKMEFPAFTEAIMLLHDEPKHYHFSNEINMIYRIVLGVDAKTFKSTHGINGNTSLRSHLNVDEIKAIETLQRIDIGLIEAGLSYEQRKTKLAECHARRIKLTAA